MTTRTNLRRIARLAATPALLTILLFPAELLAGGRPRGEGGGGGGQARAGGSVRQSHVQANQGSGVNRGAVQNRSTSATRQTNVNQNVNRNVNVNQNRNVNVNRDVDVNVHDREWGDVESVHVGEEHVYIKGEEHRVWVGEGEINVYEDHEAWKWVAGAATVAVIGSMFRTPPPVYTTVVVSSTPYYYAEGAFYSQVYSGGEVVYQVVAPPAGAVIPVLPAGCVAYPRGAIVYQQCGGYYYQPGPSGYVVVRF